MSKYETIIERVFEDEAEANGIAKELTFTREDLNRAIEETNIDVSAPPDIPYAYRARRPLPDSITAHGFRHVELVEHKEGKTIYKFAR